MLNPTFDICTCQRALAESPQREAGSTAETLFDWWCSRSESPWPWASFAFRIFAINEFGETPTMEHA